MSGLWALVPALAASAALPARAAPARPRLEEERLVLRTAAGDLVIALYRDAAPRHAAQVLKLARLGVYDGTEFSRVTSGFFAQHSGHSGRGAPLT